MTQPAISKFVDATLAFRRWAAEHLAEYGPGDWGASYDDWPAFTRAFCDLLDATEPADWDQPLVDLVLYALARDDDAEVLKDELLARPAHLMVLAEAAPLSSEYAAKWQIADALGTADVDSALVVPIIERLLQDSDEYVTRIALISLSVRGSERLEFWAKRAWDTGDQYQRMVALDAFAAAKSSHLVHYLREAEAMAVSFLCVMPPACGVRGRRRVRSA
ncbi:MAG TPA: hypothetical protein VNZ85_20705 [Caulobacter sp.]|nr:hypothetical protein [Caulobacter sp.]